MHALTNAPISTQAYTHACAHARSHTDTDMYIIQGVSRIVDITAGGDFLCLCDEKSLYKHVSDFGRLRSYGPFKA